MYIDFSFPGRPPSPFIRLARRLLSVCANSASCERLWSVFGATLTKLRNRLGVDTLTALSELKMHVRDEHLQKQTKERMKRVFAERSKAQPTAPSTSQPPPPSSESLPPRSTPNPVMQSTDVGDSEPEAARKSQATSNDSFRDLITRHSTSAIDDDLDREPVRHPEVLDRALKLSELFDFNDTHWVDLYEKALQHSFDEELEMYELLDLDADGEEDADINVDDSTGEILVG